MRRLKQLVGSFIDLTVTLVEDAVDTWATNESRSALQQKLRESADRGAELALMTHKLEDEIDSLRFNGPTLWADEVLLLQDIARTMQDNIKCSGFENLEEAGRNLQVIQHLLDRCDHMPMTAAELSIQVDKVIDGTGESRIWDPGIGKDVDELYGHDNPPPGYAKCTRPSPHSGPCAHPLLDWDTIDDDDIPF